VAWHGHGARPAEQGRGRQATGARGMWANHGKEMEWAEPGGTMTFFIYSKEFQTSSIHFDQNLNLPSSKNPK
jgi:hypothetical protein